MSQKNIILLTIDCLRADHLGCYGYKKVTSPNLDSLSKDGIRFENCYSTGPRTNESFPGIVASALSTDCGYLGDLWHRTPPKPTLGSYLKSHGYDTAARLANPQLIAEKGYDIGIEDFQNLRLSDPVELIQNEQGEVSGKINKVTDRITGKIHDIRLRMRNANAISRNVLYTPIFVAYRDYQRRNGWPTVDGRVVARELNKTVQTADFNRPLFRWAHFNDIHAPINPDRVQAVGGKSSRLLQYLADKDRICQKESREYVQMYDSMVTYVDSCVGSVIDVLRDQELWEDTVLIITGDHGEALHDRGIYGHASGQDRYVYDETREYMYNELLHVPLIVGGGAVKDTDTIKEPFSTAWIHEIVSHLTELPSGEFVRSSGLRNPFSTEDRIVISDALTPKGHTFVAVSGNQKIITKSLTPSDSICSEALLFDLDQDPEEQSPLPPKNADPAMIDAIRNNVRTVDDLPAKAGKQRVSQEAKDHLSQMGYLE